MTDKAFVSVWDAIEDNPAQAANMKHRSALMMAISKHIKARGLSQTEAAKLFAVSQPRISDLMRGKINLFSIDTLIAMLAAAGIGIEMRVRVPLARGPGLPNRTAAKKVRRRRATEITAKASRRRATA
jgi:predicted XRE-type DNA-binding protein